MHALCRFCNGRWCGPQPKVCVRVWIRREKEKKGRRNGRRSAIQMIRRVRRSLCLHQSDKLTAGLMTDISSPPMHLPILIVFILTPPQRPPRRSTTPDLCSRGYKSRKTRNRKNMMSSSNSVSPHAVSSHIHPFIFIKNRSFRWHTSHGHRGLPLPSKRDLIWGLSVTICAKTCMCWCVWACWWVSMSVNRWEWWRSRARLFLQVLMGDWHDLSITASSPYPWWQTHSRSP